MDNNQKARLFVGGLSYKATKEDVRDHFEEVGTVKSVYMTKDYERGNPNKGFAFVQMSTEDEALAAIEMFNNREGPGGRKMGVKIANEA